MFIESYRCLTPPGFSGSEVGCAIMGRAMKRESDVVVVVVGKDFVLLCDA